MKWIPTFCILLFSFSTQAQTIDTDRPDQTESSACVEKGIFQIESGMLLELAEENEIEHHNLLMPTNLFRLGLTPFLELRLLSQFEGNTHLGQFRKGISDLEFGVKIQLFAKENSNFEMAFLSHFRAPTGSIHFRNESFASINKICISHQFNSSFSLGYNLGYQFDASHNNGGIYSFAFGYDVNEKVGVYLEPFGYIHSFAKHEANFDAGFTYLIHSNVQFDFSFGTGLNHRMNYLSAGISWKSK